MEPLGEFRCRECSMAFRTLGLLEKHKALFCIGSSIGDPMVLRQEQPERKGLYPKPARTPDLIRLREQRGMHLQNMQGRTNDTERRAGKEDNLRGSVSESLALRNLTNEFHKLRMSIEGSMPNLPKWPTETEGLEDQVQVLGRKCAHRERMREMAEQHEQQLAEIQTHNHLLEQQREDIAWQLGALAGQGSTAHLETLLLELRDREERNEEALQQLKDHITTLQPGVKEVTFDSPNPDHRKGHNVNFDLISSVDGPLSTQIRALRLDYMQSGGSDPAVLAQMHDMQAEAHTLEQQAQSGADNKGRRKRMKPPQQAGNSEVLAVEQENQRLEEEIFRIQLARDKHRREDVAVGSELHQIQREHTHYMASIQAELKSLHREVERAREGPRDRRLPPPPPPLFPAPPAMHPLAQIYSPPALTQPGPHSSLKERHVLDSLGPAPYDPAAGFAVFYDLMLGVDATLGVLRPVAGLYSGGQEVGRPTPLPPTQCQPGGGQPYSQTVPPGNYALLAVKQPMPRMQPSPSLSLVVELQAAGALDTYGQEVQRLVSRGWARLELFDQHNQVQSGYWRVPVRALPVRPSLSPVQLNSVPQVGNMELCLRVVNARDWDVQSLAKIDPSNTSHYKYPSMVSNIPATLQGNRPVSMSTLQPSAANHFLSLLPYTDHEDPPPMEEPNQR
ncbi:coiled-coil domain-containing protein 17 [Salmo salar]|uniref:Coiled-coil domain-containing protein 17 n=1 Tax=Salmo salar TaxID=8030 RepID=A0A1S3P9C2_SALSA|nr:coiled-coil domain-containing protein 17 [Salmo salar]|eukprot:XP_014024204.1 PREDICTED: coiled-coil domain-containing protein 17-like [Salmo salar]